jgi:heme exporter protein D
MGRFTESAKTLAEVAKVIGVILSALALVGGGFRAYAWLSTRADATELAVLKAQRVSDHELLLYGIKRIDTVGDQLNHQALTGRVPYVEPPPAPPEVLGPVAAPGKSDATR